MEGEKIGGDVSSPPDIATIPTPVSEDVATSLWADVDEDAEDEDALAAYTRAADKRKQKKPKANASERKRTRMRIETIRKFRRSPEEEPRRLRK